MIDFKRVREKVRFTVEHHGTNTQGEAHRFDQVADALTEMFEQLVVANQAVEASLEAYKHNSVLIKVSP